MQEMAPLEVQQSIKKSQNLFSSLDPQVQVMVWSEKQIIDLLVQQYSHCLKRYLQVMNTIQRCDIARAFILHAHGGLYMDIDFNPNASMVEFFREPLLWNSHKVIVGQNSLLGVNNAWIYSNKGNLFWEKYLSLAFGEIESPTLLNIFISLVFPTWSIISSTGPEIYNKLREYLEIDARVYESWGEHGKNSQPTWFNKLACTQQTLMVLCLIVFSLGFFTKST